MYCEKCGSKTKVSNTRKFDGGYNKHIPKRLQNLSGNFVFRIHHCESCKHVFNSLEVSESFIQRIEDIVYAKAKHDFVKQVNFTLQRL